MKLPETVSPNAIAMTFSIGAKHLMGPHFKVDEQDAIGHELGRRYNEHAALCDVADAAKEFVFGKIPEHALLEKFAALAAIRGGRL